MRPKTVTALRTAARYRRAPVVTVIATWCVAAMVRQGRGVDAAGPDRPAKHWGIPGR